MPELPQQRPAPHDRWDDALRDLLAAAAYRDAGERGDVVALLEPYGWSA